MFIKIENDNVVGHAITYENLRALFPNVSFPPYLSQKDVEAFGYAVFETVEPPAPKNDEKVVQSAPIKINSGLYRQSFLVVKLDAEELLDRETELASAARVQREDLFLRCDWTQLPDAPLSQAQKEVWAQYRQALRDVTNQSGFPFNVQWPEQPK